MNEPMSKLRQDIEAVFKEVGGFTWEQAQVWAGFCDAVGMDPLPFLTVMLGGLCDIKCARRKENLPSCAQKPELWVHLRDHRTTFTLLEP